jgi:hypothetical protein
MSEDRQRVNLQVSVRLDKLDKEVSRLLDDAMDIIAGINTQVRFENYLSLDNIDTIDSIRVSLADADATLLDVCNIINSYVSYKTQQNQTTQESTTPQPPMPGQHMPMPNMDVLSELEERISSFKNKYGGGDTEETNNNNVSDT